MKKLLLFLAAMLICFTAFSQKKGTTRTEFLLEAHDVIERAAGRIAASLGTKYSLVKTYDDVTAIDTRVQDVYWFPATPARTEQALIRFLKEVPIPYSVRRTDSTGEIFYRLDTEFVRFQFLIRESGSLNNSTIMFQMMRPHRDEDRGQ